MDAAAEARAYTDQELRKLRAEMASRGQVWKHGDTHRAGGMDSLPATGGPPTGPAGGGLSGNYPNPLVNSVPPSGPAGGGLSGTYPNPTVNSVPPGGPAGGELSGTYPNPNLANLTANWVQAGLFGIWTAGSMSIGSATAPGMTLSVIGSASVQPSGGVGNGITIPSDLYRLGMAVHTKLVAANMALGSYPDAAGLNLTTIPTGDFTTAAKRVLQGLTCTVLAGNTLGDMQGTAAVYGADVEAYASNLGAAVTIPALYGLLAQVGFWKNGAADGSGTITDAVSLWAKPPDRYNGATGGNFTQADSLRVTVPTLGATKYAINIVDASNVTQAAVDSSGQWEVFGGRFNFYFNPANSLYTAVGRPVGGTNSAILYYPTNTPIANQVLAVGSISTAAGVDTITTQWAAAGGPPSGAAGGELGGTYPNPTVNVTHAGTSHLLVETLLYPIGDGINVIPTGFYGDIQIQFAATVLSWVVLCSLPAAGGAVQFDLWKTTYANFDAGTTHPVVADTITGSDKPRIIATATKGTSSALTGWTTALAVGDILRINVDSATAIKLALLVLKVQRT